MKLKYIEGDLIKLAVNYDVIAHCCNCFCTMASGIAPQIKEAFPEAYIVDCATVKGDREKLGTISYTENTVPTVVNLYGQYGYGGRIYGQMDLSYEALEHALTDLMLNFKGKRFAMPMIGAGLAGGDWNKIEKMIEDIFEGEDVTIIKYKP